MIAPVAKATASRMLRPLPRRASWPITSSPGLPRAISAVSGNQDLIAKAPPTEITHCFGDGLWNHARFVVGGENQADLRVQNHGGSKSSSIVPLLPPPSAAVSNFRGEDGGARPPMTPPGG